MQMGLSSFLTAAKVNYFWVNFSIDVFEMAPHGPVYQDTLLIHTLIFILFILISS